MPISAPRTHEWVYNAYVEAVLTRWLAVIAGLWFAADLVAAGLATTVLFPSYWGYSVVAVIAGVAVTCATLRYRRTRRQRPFQHLRTDVRRGGVSEASWRAAVLPLIPVVLLLLGLYTGTRPTPEQALTLIWCTVAMELFLLPVWVPWLLAARRKQQILAQHGAAHPAELAVLEEVASHAATPADALNQLARWKTPSRAV